MLTIKVVAGSYQGPAAYHASVPSKVNPYFAAGKTEARAVNKMCTADQCWEWSWLAPQRDVPSLPSPCLLLSLQVEARKRPPSLGGSSLLPLSPGPRTLPGLKLRWNFSFLSFQLQRTKQKPEACTNTWLNLRKLGKDSNVRSETLINPAYFLSQ